MVLVPASGATSGSSIAVQSYRFLPPIARPREGSQPPPRLRPPQNEQKEWRKQPILSQNLALDPARALSGDKLVYKLALPPRRLHGSRSSAAILQGSSPRSRDPDTAAATAVVPSVPTVDVGEVAAVGASSLDLDLPDVPSERPDEVAASAATAAGGAGGGGDGRPVGEPAACGAPLPAAQRMPLLRGRERVQLFRNCPLLSTLSERALQGLAAVATERTLPRYGSVRPSRSLCVLVHGAFSCDQGGGSSALARFPPELITTAPTLTAAAAAAAVASDCAFAATVSETGATLGLSSALREEAAIAEPPSFLATQPR